MAHRPIREFPTGPPVKTGKTKRGFGEIFAKQPSTGERQYHATTATLALSQIPTISSSAGIEAEETPGVLRSNSRWKRRNLSAAAVYFSPCRPESADRLSLPTVTFLGWLSLYWYTRKRPMLVYYQQLQCGPQDPSSTVADHTTSTLLLGWKDELS
ncbi:hypothetical protein SORBI_3003G338300 [Sorghum bicolor]|uniref:Uncharacterized protein n=1 Tax=Sorghum bicolor TaxID=4558 RepID=A0A1B6Q6S0_SORBI|nr:hypothetical protein SORBI_3003G338300 [Sorghum bicolor]